MKRLVIVGAGTGGLMVANFVARDLSREIAHGEISVTLLGDKDEYIYQPGFLYVVFDLMRPAQLIRPIKELLAPGIEFVHDRAVRIDPEGKVVERAGGEALHYDYLVLATGSGLNLQEVPGLSEGGHWFYTLEGALQLRDELRRFQGGRVVLTVGVPHKCPVAPLEFTMMFDEWARVRGIREQTEIVYTYPLGRTHSIPSVAEWAQPELEHRGVRVETFFNMESVEPEKKVVHSLEGTDVAYDVLVAIPPHRGDELGAVSGLAEAGNWYPTDRNRLNLNGRDDIFVLGDATNLPVSKAGSVAHFEAEVLADNLVGLLTEGSPPAYQYNGRAFCFIETGLERATFISFDYLNPPKVPQPTNAVHWFKQTYNRIHWANLKAVM
jgi:sulfide:quinone oxidoreductase